MEFEWDPVKAARNLVKHGVSFQEAATVFSSPLTMTYFDLDHSDDENRFLSFGESDKGRMVVVSHTDRDDRVRIISARIMSRKEKKKYEETNKK